MRKFKIIAVTIKRVSLLVANGNRFEKEESTSKACLERWISLFQSHLKAATKG